MSLHTTPEQRMHAYLAALVSIPTVSDDYAANHVAIDYLVEFFSTRGMHIARFEFDGHEAFVATSRRTKTPAVMLAAHVDIIPARAGMYALEFKDAAIIGRGTYDMKGAIAVYMEFIDSIKDTLADYDIGIMITTDEELGGKDGKNGVQQLVARGYIPKMCILPDGGENWQLETAAKSYLHFTLEAHGRTGHGSRPWLSDNAAYKIMDAVHEIRTHFPDPGPKTATFNLGMIEGGEAPNKVPAFVRAEVEMRAVGEHQTAHLKELIPAICKKHDVKAEQRAVINPIYNSLTNPYIAEFAASIYKATGVTCEGFLSMAGSDARFFTEVHVPCAVFYPTGGGHHSDTEWISEDSLPKMLAIITDYAQKIAKV